LKAVNANRITEENTRLMWLRSLLWLVVFINNQPLAAGRQFSDALIAERDGNRKQTRFPFDICTAAMYGVYKSILEPYNKHIRPILHRRMDVLLDLQLYSIEEVVSVWL
jgi:hypothetical protein